MVYHVQKQEKLNVLNDITLVQAPEDDYDIIAGIYGEEATYDGDWNVEVYSDADWACARADYRSTSGLVILWCGCLVFAAARLASAIQRRI